MPAIQYPTELPTPSTGDLTAFERRQITEGDGPRQDRAMQREWLALQELEFRFNESEAETFQAWWDADLYQGGAWFSAVWPLPQGLVETARRFLGTPKWDLADAGIWFVRADSEVRGGGELPQTPPPPSTDALILVDPRDPASLTYGAAYLADFPTAVGFDAANPGLTAIGSAGEIVSVGGVAGASFANAAATEGAGKGNTVDVSTLTTVVEFRVVSLPSSVAKVAVGVFSPSFGPAGNLDNYLLGYQTLATYWTSDGKAYGYGGSEDTVAAFDQGDVVGLVVDGPSAQAHYYLNGTSTGIVVPIGNVNALYHFVSVISLS